MTDPTCNQWKCTDEADKPIPLENGDEAHLCEDHANMTVDGEPVEGYEPNDPEKFDL